MSQSGEWDSLNSPVTPGATSIFLARPLKALNQKFGVWATGLGMYRIILPLLVIAAILFAPMFSEVTVGPITGKETTPRSGNYFVEDTIKCFQNQQFSVGGECTPKMGATGMAVFAAIAASAVAAVIGVPGLLPFVGRATSVVTTIAGLIALGAMGYFILTVMGAAKGSAEVLWGSYLAGGLALLTLVAGLSGIRGS